MATPVGQRVSVRARELHDHGADTVPGLPSVEEIKAMPADERHDALEGLRVELYAVAAVVADGAVQRAYQAAADYPPYGLVRSMQSDVREMGAAPSVVEAGDIDGFYVLGKAYVETVVFHLHRQFEEYSETGQGWLAEHLRALLALFSVDADATAKPRLRDPVSFIYGGLHFGTGVTVQLVEVMSRMLDDHGGIGLDDKVEIITRSSRPAYYIATLNLDHVVRAYRRLQGVQRPALRPDRGLSLVSWMDEAKFELTLADGRPSRIELREDALAGQVSRRPLEDRPTTYTTHGCPARIAPAGGPSAIATLWTWGVELARDTGLLGLRAQET